MADRPTVGILGGNGWMGSALGRNALSAGLIAPEHLLVSTSRRNWSYRDWPGVTPTPSHLLIERSDILILAVRPEHFAPLVIDASGKLVISIMARVPMAMIQEKTRSQQTVRAMPNAAAEFRQSYTPWQASPQVDDTRKSWLQEFFAASGAEDEVSCEQHIDYLTALTGSGPAFPALIANILIEHAMSRGLSEAQATRAVVTTLDGAARVFQHGPDTPAELVRRFLSYAGTTTEGLKAMMTHGLNEALFAGVDAAENAASTAPD